MKHLILLLLIVFSFQNTYAQNIISNHILQVSIDSLVRNVRDLSGEDSTLVGGVKTIITDRINETGNDIAADYIFERLNSYGLNVSNQNYDTLGRNVIAVQIGQKYPDSLLIICAHYDAVAAYAADDNASGTAAVLETARILSNYQFDLTIVYAFWDEEEIGLCGSRNYAAQAAINQQKIAGVVNLDMLGYDSDADKVFEIHSNQDSNSLRLKDSIISIINTYNLDLIPMVYSPGTSASDHSVFWRNNFASILLIESLAGGDFNRSLHTVNDSINLFNLSYFEELSKLVVGVTAAIAIPNNGASNGEVMDNLATLVNVFPNPTTSQFNLICPKEWKKVEVIDMKSNVLITEFNNKSVLPINLSDYSSGLYAIIIYFQDEIITKNVIKH